MEILKISLGTVLGKAVPADPAPAGLRPGDLSASLSHSGLCLSTKVFIAHGTSNANILLSNFC